MFRMRMDNFFRKDQRDTGISNNSRGNWSQRELMRKVNTWQPSWQGRDPEVASDLLESGMLFCRIYL